MVLCDFLFIVCAISQHSCTVFIYLVFLYLEPLFLLIHLATPSSFKLQLKCFFIFSKPSPLLPLFIKIGCPLLVPPSYLVHTLLKHSVLCIGVEYLLFPSPSGSRKLFSVNRFLGLSLDLLNQTLQ